MSSRLKILLILVLTTTGSISYGQMIEGDYPFQVIDSLIFSKSDNIFQIDTNSKPNNFISKSESHYKLSLEVNKEQSDFSLKRINEIHSKTNNRDFIAGISNYSSDTIFIPIQDLSLISIIEAKDKNGLWKPIQFWPISRCGNSYYSETILPNQTLLFTIEKDFGEIPTLMRLRLHGTDTIFVSKEFNGTINESMFKVKENIVKDYNHILCDSIFYLESPRFGNLNYDDDIEIEVIEENE